MQQALVDTQMAIADTRMTMSMRYLLRQINTLEKLGFSQSDSRKALNFSDDIFSNKAARIPIDAVLPLFEAAEKALNEPLIGLQVGFQFRAANYARTGSIYSHCENLLQVIEMNQRYQRLAIDVAEIHYEVITGDDNIPRHHMCFITYYDDHVRYRHITDLVMGAYGTTYRWLSWGSGEDIKAVYLPYEEPKNKSLYQKVFQCEAHFNSPKGIMEYSANMMTQPLTTHDPEKLAHTIAQLDKIMGTLNTKASLKNAIETSMRAALKTGSISTAILSKRLGRSERQLRKEMKESDLKYRALLDTVRQDMFLELHKKGDSFSTIAQSLAYNDQAAFNRAFRRWYEVSPSQWSSEHENKDLKLM